ncbi:hypothetical protein ACTFIW_002263 [Dictyostelium discoideum]
MGISIQEKVYHQETGLASSITTTNQTKNNINNNLYDKESNLGRDLIWRYLLKALPKYFGELCYSCGETESSEHIFFNCKLIQPICNKIYSRLTSITNNTNYGVWSEFDFKDKAITFKMTVYILSKARDADWDRTIKTIEHLRRLGLNNHQIDHTWKIMKKLEKLSHVWNSQLMKTYIPEHLIHYCSFNTNFLKSNN